MTRCRLSRRQVSWTTRSRTPFLGGRLLSLLRWFNLCYVPGRMRYLVTIALLFSLALGCEDEIGDGCTIDADCSPNMDRNCDRSQPGGYCLIIGCGADECPNEAVCVEFTTPCPLDMEEENCQLIEPNRGRTYCLKHCKKNSDCRKKYDCITPEEISATILDFETNRSKICVPEPD